MVTENIFQEKQDCHRLRELFDLFPEATRYLFGKEQSLEKIENLLSPVKDGKESFSMKHLLIIEDKDKKFWHFSHWGSFPHFDDNQFYEISKILKIRKHKKECITQLYKFFKNIEHVSVILRFIDPDNYGIFTPPVEKILETKRSYNPIQTYLNYLDDLETIRKSCSNFPRIADIDVAIWVLSNLVRKERSGLIKDYIEKWAPEHYYKIKDFLLRPNSLIKKLKVINTPDDIWEEEPLDKARMLFEKDLFAAGLIAGNIIKIKLPTICQNLDIKITYLKNGNLCYCKVKRMLNKLFDDNFISFLEKKRIGRAWRIRNNICEDQKNATPSAVKELFDTAEFILNKFQNYI
jgi:hypothetical protein